MSSQPSSSPQAVGGTGEARTTGPAASSIAPLIGAILTIALGIALGLANQAADGTAMALRVPALLAALLMVGQGAFDVKRHSPQVRRRTIVEPQPPQSRVINETGQPAVRQAELATVHKLPPPQPISVGSVKANPQTLTVPIVVMVLAAWLGLADLRVEAPPTLAVLSLIASFALFALGWSLLPARR